ncbi:MAG: O-antigen ligase family protein [Victivallales bacterium]|nr:O-antigen ligase family protein [Victivallales bacterium]
MVNPGLLLASSGQSFQVKYLVFAATLFCGIPAVLALVLDRRLLGFAILGLVLPLLNFDGTAINLISMELYRGTARGMEISLCYLVAIAIIVAVTLRGGLKLRLPCMGSVLYFLYFMLSVCSLRHSGDRLISFFELWKMIMMYVVFLAVSCYMEYTKGDFDVFEYGLGVFVVINLYFVLKQHYFGNGVVYGVFPHKNSMAMFMALADIILFSVFMNTIKEKKSWLFLFLFSCGAVSSLRTYSRGGVVSLPMSILICFAISSFCQFRARKILRFLLIFVVFVAGFLLFLPKIILRFETAGENSYLARVQFATIARNIISDNKIFGIGINNWSRTLQQNRDYKINRQTNERMYLIRDGIVETIYLLVAAECGIPCLVALLLWFFYYFFLSLKLAYCLRDTKYFYFPAATAGGLLAIYLQSMLEWVLKQSINFILLMIVYAMLSYRDRNWRQLVQREKEEKGQSSDASEDNISGGAHESALQ